MHITFNTDKINKQCWLSVESYRRDISILSNSGKEECMLDVNLDGDKLYFEYQGDRVYIHDMEKMSIAELRKKLEEDESSCLTRDFILAIICDGVDNVRLGVELDVASQVVAPLGIAVFNGSKQYMPCKIVEGFNSEPHHGYKLDLHPAVESLTDEEKDMLPFISNRRTYTDDIWGMIKYGAIKLLDSVEDGKTVEEHIDEYFVKYA